MEVHRRMESGVSGEAGVGHENVRSCQYVDDIQALGMDEIA